LYKKFVEIRAFEKKHIVDSTSVIKDRIIDIKNKKFLGLTWRIQYLGLVLKKDVRREKKKRRIE
jgi:hypothetical protein